jgi:hypothetical protein
MRVRWPPPHQPPPASQAPARASAAPQHSAPPPISPPGSGLQAPALLPHLHKPSQHFLQVSLARIPVATQSSPTRTRNSPPPGLLLRSHQHSTNAAFPNADPPQPHLHAQLHSLGEGERRGGQRILEEFPHAKPSLAPGMLLGCLCLQCFNANATGGYSLTFGPQRSPSWKSPPMVYENCSNQLLKHLSHLFPP